MSTLETWAFGTTNFFTWTTIVATIHAELGTAAIFVWIPAVVIGMLINYQIKNIGKNLLYVAGGTPNYITRLWQKYPILARYAAIGYILTKLSYIPLNSLILTDLIKSNLDILGFNCPELIIKIGFTLLPFIIAFSGARSLNILHLFFTLPAFVYISIFCLQGLGFLALSPQTPGLFPQNWESINFIEWCKWFFFICYTTYSGDTISAFISDSLHPIRTLKFLNMISWLMPVIFIGGSWVIARLSNLEDLGDNAYLTFAVATVNFWGENANIITTFFLASACLLCSVTSVSNCPRIIYQLSIDKHLAPVFSVVSSRGVFGTALIFSFLICSAYLMWGNFTQIVLMANTAWLITFILFHLGLWRKRKESNILFPYLSLAIAILEILILLIAAYAWGWQNFVLGLLAPLVILIIDTLVRYIPIKIFSPNWWVKLYQAQRKAPVRDYLAIQVIILMFLLCIAVLIGCTFVWQLKAPPLTSAKNLIVVLLMTVAFMGVAIACWTSLPQVIALAEARESTEYLFNIAQDGILVIDQQGIIQKANPATEIFFGVSPLELLGTDLKKWLPELTNYPENWSKFSEHALSNNHKTIELSISGRKYQEFPEYVVMIHDITQRKQIEQILLQSETKLKQEAQQLAAQLIESEKMSSLGQLVAGVAHEINNPISFIYGNLTPASEYIQDLINLVQLYQQHYPQPVKEIKAEAENIDLDFLMEDLPKLLTSMQIGAERIRKIVLSLRNFSRLDEAEIKLVNIHEGIDSTLMILENRLQASKNRPAIQVIKNYHQLPKIECYAGQMNQVFMSILANAIDALEEAMNNGKFGENNDPSISQPQIEITTNITNEEQVSICFTDNGVGIPTEVQQRLFEPFFTTKPVGKGTGLGLSISYKTITNRHGGSLKLISDIGKGTKFLITIPIKQKSQHSVVSSQTVSYSREEGNLNREQC
jgi:PAS domain S-box-containing protein